MNQGNEAPASAGHLPPLVIVGESEPCFPSPPHPPARCLRVPSARAVLGSLLPGRQGATTLLPAAIERLVNLGGWPSATLPFRSLANEGVPYGTPFGFGDCDGETTTTLVGDVSDYNAAGNVKRRHLP
ncbi:hypothetical protein Scep_028454 [Stephania cephalantha]|uniref:Uncharacterized protein n=1 Tax=Stephania cephalantha TaxID=152367 RepID=A0AAP0EEJ9_9MAGN